METPLTVSLYRITKSGTVVATCKQSSLAEALTYRYNCHNQLVALSRLVLELADKSFQELAEFGHISKPTATEYRGAKLALEALAKSTHQ